MQSKPKVLIITYYSPPFGGSGVQRWLKFTKYLPKFGWEPIVYTADNPEFMVIDNSLCGEVLFETEVIKRKIIEPYALYRFITRKKRGDIKPGFINSGKGISLFIRSNIFIPDPKAMWILPSVRFLKKEVRKRKIDVIVSTGPPHSMHLIARSLSRSLKIPWVADFRDPWTNMFTFKYMRYSALTKRLHSTLEKKVLKDANAVIAVTPTTMEEFKEIRGSDKGLYVITNGYDSEDFSNLDVKRDEEFSITYTGLFMNSQNPRILWEALRELIKEDPSFAKSLRIRFVGNIDSTIIDDISVNGLTKYLERVEYMSHDEVVRVQMRSQILLLAGSSDPEGKGIIAGKLFEYLAAERPIMGFAQKGGDMDHLLNETNGGVIFDYSDREGCKLWLKERYRDYLNGELSVKSVNIDKYSREGLTSALVSVLDKVKEIKRDEKV